MNEKIVVYKVHCDGSWCAFDDIDSAVKLLSDEIEAEADELKPGEKTREYRIEVCEMTQEQYSRLSEFQGF